MTVTSRARLAVVRAVKAGAIGANGLLEPPIAVPHAGTWGDHSRSARGADDR
jgi:hypothetical protein